VRWAGAESTRWYVPFAAVCFAIGLVLRDARSALHQHMRPEPKSAVGVNLGRSNLPEGRTDYSAG
jgi:hypothetical protein